MIAEIDFLVTFGVSSTNKRSIFLNIALTPELEQMVNDKVNNGPYQSAGDVVLEALRLMNERDEQMELLRRDIRAGFEAVEQGKFTEYDESNVFEIALRVNARGLERLARRSHR